MAFVLVLLVASCGKKPYTVLEVGGADSRSVANHDSDIVLEIKSEKDLKLNKNKTFELNIKSYDVEYSTKDVVLSRLEDGKYAIEYYMDAKMTPKAEGKLGFMETNHFLIYVEK